MAVIRTWSAPVRAVLLAAFLVVVWTAFRELATVFVLLVMTLVIAIPLDACATWLARHRVPRPIGALLGLLLGLGTLAALVAVILPPFLEQVQQLVDVVPAVLHDVEVRVADLTGAGRSEAGERVREFLQGYLDRPLRLLGPAASIGLGVVGVLATAVLVLMTAYYVAANPGPLRDALLSLFPADRRDVVLLVLTDVRAAWAGWLRGVGVDMVVSGLLLYIGLRLIGLDYAVVFAALSALLVVVPYIGAIVGAIPPVLLALSHSPHQALVTLAIYLVVQQIEGNVIVPLVMSRMVKLHPAAIIIGVVFVGRMLGITGLFVAVPIIVAVVILVQRLWVSPLQRPGASRARAADGLRAREPVG